MILLILMAGVSDTTILGFVLYFSYQIYNKLNMLQAEMHPKVSVDLFLMSIFEFQTRKMQSHMNRMLTVQVKLIKFKTGLHEKECSFAQRQH